MLEELWTKEYLVILLVVVVAYLLLLLNPTSLQNKNYKLDGNTCPNPGWHALVLLIVGTLLFVFVNRYSVTPK